MYTLTSITPCNEHCLYPTSSLPSTHHTSAGSRVPITLCMKAFSAHGSVLCSVWRSSLNSPNRTGASGGKSQDASSLGGDTAKARSTQLHMCPGKIEIQLTSVNCSVAHHEFLLASPPASFSSLHSYVFWDPLCSGCLRRQMDSHPGFVSGVRADNNVSHIPRG